MKKKQKEVGAEEENNRISNDENRASESETDEVSLDSTKIHTSIRDSFVPRDIANSIFSRNESCSLASDTPMVIEYDDEDEAEEESGNPPDPRINYTISIDSVPSEIKEESDSMRESTKSSRLNRFQNLDVIEEDSNEELYRTDKTTKK